MDDQCPKKLRKFRANLWVRYRIRFERFMEILESQDHKCAICSRDLKIGSPDKRNPAKPVVDHCHDSLNVRGILCHDCNLLISFAKNDTDVLHRAIVYLAQRSVL